MWVALSPFGLMPEVSEAHAVEPHAQGRMPGR